MESLKYKIVKNAGQYEEYCNLLEILVDQPESEKHEEEIELLTLLIEKWDEEHSTLKESDPVELLKFLMIENQLKSKDLSELLGVGKSVVSEILSYKKGFSKEIIRKLADRFKLKQDAFNRPYALKIVSKRKVVEAAVN